MSERALHHLVVTIDPRQTEPGHTWSPDHEGCDLCNDAPFEWEIECPGIEAGGCEAWQECGTCQDALTACGDDDDARDAYIEAAIEDGAHGEEHMLYDGAPCVRSGGCYVADASPDDFWEIAREHGPGRHAFEWTGGSWEDFEAFYVVESEATR